MACVLLDRQDVIAEQDRVKALCEEAARADRALAAGVEALAVRLVDDEDVRLRDVATILGSAPGTS